MIFDDSWLKGTMYKNIVHTQMLSFGLRKQLPILHPKWRHVEKGMLVQFEASFLPKQVWFQAENVNLAIIFY